MSDYLSKLDNKKFQNWLKAFLALNITKEGIENFVSRRISNCHSEILDRILSKQQRERKEFCESCDIDKVVPCVTNQKHQYCHVCDPFRDHIRRKHVNNNPSWKNTQSKKWCNNPWEMAKCYMPPIDGYKRADSVEQTDFNGIISILLNHTDLSKDVNTEICNEVRRISNDIRHTTNLLLEDAKLDNFVDKLVELLTCTEQLKDDPGAVEAHQDLVQLKANTLVVSTQDITKIVQTVSKDNKENIIVQLNDIEEYLKTTDIKAGKDFGALCAAVKLLAAKYIQLEQNLKADLIDFYKEEYGHITLSPLVAENDVEIIDFYVKPKLEKKAWGSFKRTPQTSVKTYEDIIGKGMESFRNVYLCGQAGTGKTTFVKHLCTVWCCAKCEHERKPVGVSDEDFDTMKHFDFLFLILLRYAHVGNIDDMIMSQVIDNLSRGSQYNNEFIQHILHNHRCLVIMDGLDEWYSPDPKHLLPMPHKRVRKRCTMLSTTRPWKMYELMVPQSKVNNYIEITFLGETSVKTLITNVIDKIKDGNEHIMTADDFLGVIKDLHLEDLMYTPVILIQLVLLWHDKRDLGQSRCEIYSNIIEYILEMSEQKHKDLRRDQFASDCSNTFPDCFKGKQIYERYYKLLLALGKLAFETLFKKRKESSIVFDDETLRSSISDECMRECCFKIGLLTKCKDSKVLSKRVFKYSFMHKTFQEFFCALYIKSLDDFTVDDARKVCSSLLAILDMAHVFVFLGGLCTKTAANLSIMGAGIVANDPITLDFRSRVSTAIEWHERFKCLKEYQDMFVESVQEGQGQIKDAGDIFAMDDFFVSDQCCKTTYRNAFKSLLDMNRKTIKTITIYDCGKEETIHRYIEELNLGDVRSLKKVEIIGHLNAKDIDGILDGSEETLECLTLCVDRRRYKEWKKYVTLSELCIKKIATMKNLVAVMLECFKLPHTCLEYLLQFLTNRKDMRQINLAFISCSDHGDNCTGFDLDLSSHTDLDMLQLGNIPVSNLKLCVKALKQCRIGSFTNVNVLVSILEALSNSGGKLQTTHTIRTESHEQKGDGFPASCKHCLPVQEATGNDIKDVQDVITSKRKYELQEKEVPECDFQPDKTAEEKILAKTLQTECNCNLLSFMCFDSHSTAETGKVLDIMPSLNSLKTLILKKIEILEEHVRAPPHVDHIKLAEVSMSVKAFNKFLTEVNKNEESVRLEIVDCKITPEDKYQSCKEEIQSSERYVVHYEGSSERFGNQFVFTKLNKSSIHRISSVL